MLGKPGAGGDPDPELPPPFTRDRRAPPMSYEEPRPPLDSAEIDDGEADGGDDAEFDDFADLYYGE